MNSRPTWVLLAAVALLLAYIVLVEQPLRRQRELQASRVILPNFDPALVTNVEIRPWGRPLIEAARQNTLTQSWKLVQPVAYPAESQDITALLAVLGKLEWMDRLTERELAERPLAQEEFGFTNPPFTILLQGAGSDRRLEIGTLGAFNDRLSLQVVGDNTIYQTTPEILHLIPRDKNDWRDLSFLNLTNLSFQTLSVRSPGKEFELQRNPTNHLWFMRKPTARADTPKINELLARLQSALVLSFRSDDPQADLEPYGLQNSDTTPSLALSFLDGTNKVTGLQVGRNWTNFPDLVFARRDDPSNIVAVSNDVFKPWEASYTNFLDQHLISLPPALVESIAVRGEDNFAVLKQTNGQWRVMADKSYPADPILMGFWLTSLTNVPTAIVKSVVTDFSPYGLSNAPLQYVIHFGAEAGSRDAHIDFGTNAAGKVFERRQDEDFVNSISAQDFYWLPRVSWQLRDRQVWNFDSSNVLSVTVHQKGGELKLLRDPDGNWTYAPGFNMQEPINSAATEECVFRMGHLGAIYWDGVGDKDLDRFGFAKTAHELQFEVKHTGTNEIYRIQFGARSPFQHPYASIIRDGERLIFEFPADLYENLVLPNLTLFTARHPYR